MPEHCFCVNHGHNGEYLCYGDSGAGFMIRSEDRKDRRYFLRGLVSTGYADEGDCTEENFVVFTDVTKFYNKLR